jgi:hypothetical protein
MHFRRAIVLGVFLILLPWRKVVAAEQLAEPVLEAQALAAVKAASARRQHRRECRGRRSACGTGWRRSFRGRGRWRRPLQQHSWNKHWIFHFNRPWSEPALRVDRRRRCAIRCY